MSVFHYGCNAHLCILLNAIQNTFFVVTLIDKYFSMFKNIYTLV